MEEFGYRWPYLHHVINRKNLCALGGGRTLYSAAVLTEKGGRREAIAARRRESIAIDLSGHAIWLRDQIPLHMAHVAFEDDWGPANFLRALAGYVFLWPGTSAGPVRYGRSHFSTYAKSDVVLRLPFAAVKSQGPLFCRYNSGAPRSSRGRKSPRGPSTFSPAAFCSFPVGSVVEVVFPNQLVLPRDTVWADSVTGPWFPLE